MKTFKAHINEGKTSGADFEVAIVLGWYGMIPISRVRELKL